jgi:hypothetical protein
MSAQRCPAPTAPSPPPTPQMLHGEAYVAGGWDGRAVLASAERLDLASGRSSASNSSKRNRVCAARKICKPLSQRPSPCALCAERRWVRIADMRVPRASPALAVLGGFLYAIGGFNG